MSKVWVRRGIGAGMAVLLLTLAGLAEAEGFRDRIRQRLEDRRNNAPAEQQQDNRPSLSGSTQATEVETVLVGGLKREYRLFAPPTARRNAPLVIVLHGTYGTGEKMQRGLGFDPYARRHNFLVAYPDAYRKEGDRSTTRWNDGRGVLDSSKMGIDDVAFISALIDDVARKHDIDRRRVFVTGASNGGMMAYRVGCELAGQVRAIAPEIGNVPQPLSASCNPQAGLSILSINGAEDPLIPLDGGEVCQGVSKRMCEGGQVLSRTESLSYFARANGCAAPSSSRRQPRVSDGTEVEDIVYGNCQSGAQVRSIVVHGMGHVWPPNEGQAKVSGPSSQNLDATAEVVNFFMSFR